MLSHPTIPASERQGQEEMWEEGQVSIVNGARPGEHICISWLGGYGWKVRSARSNSTTEQHCLKITGRKYSIKLMEWSSLTSSPPSLLVFTFYLLRKTQGGHSQVADSTAALSGAHSIPILLLCSLPPLFAVSSFTLMLPALGHALCSFWATVSKQHFVQLKIMLESTHF